MLCSDPTTFDSLRKLWGLANTPNRKPLLVWVGAGASSWLGYERWEDVAQRFHRSFVKHTSGYKSAEASDALAKEDYPALFQICFEADPQLYRSLLKDSFSPRPMKPVYRRFLGALERIERVSVITTNVDEMLEHTLPVPNFELVQRSDISRAIDLLSSDRAFIAKIHGSISSVETTVFRSDDYNEISRDEPFLNCLKYLFTACSVLFIGYGVRDQYVVDLLKRNATLHSLFGDGPHFLISTTPRPELPSSVNLIQYNTAFHVDHRSSILSLELVARPKSEIISFGSGLVEPPSVALRSAHLLSDFYPAGTWTSGNIFELKDAENERTLQMIVGPDWSVGEVPSYSTAAHDLAMGLICFDQVLVPLECISRVFKLVGGVRFEALVNNDVLLFVHGEGYDSVMVQPDHVGFGFLATGKSKAGDPEEVMKRQFSPVPGKEAGATALMSRIERNAIHVDLSGSKNFADICNGLFVSPPIRSVLGISEATPAGRIPRWAAHPALRVVQIARIGATCQQLNLGSMKLMTGAARMAEIAFSAVAQGVLADEPGSYTLTGQIGIIAENEFRSQPGIWDAIMSFRERSAGLDLRREILKRLANNEGAEIIPALNSSLREMIPLTVLTRAQKEMAGLLLTSGIHPVVSAVWSDSALLQNGPEI